MKTRLLSLMYCFCLGMAVGQNRIEPTPEEGAKLKLAPAAIIERGPHHRVWERVEYEPAPGGRTVPRRHVYQELATGMHYQDETGEWQESEAKIEVLPQNAGATAAKGQHKVIFPPDIYDGQIELNLLDGSWLRSRVLGLSYIDVESGKNVLIAELTNSVGEIHGDNVVLYPNAFTDFRADLRYTYTRDGFEQDVVLRENIPLPEDFGLNPKTTRLQVLTEFFDPPAPIKTEQVAEAKSGDIIPDQTLSFGDMQMGVGKAFPQTSDSGETIPVGKQWQQFDGRDFLIEEVQAADLLPFLDKLSKLDSASLETFPKVRRLASIDRQLPAKRRVVKKEERKPNKTLRLASAPQPRDGFVLDYVTLNTSLTNYVFQGDSTYYLSGNVSLYGTNTTFEPNAVIKYTNNVSLTVNSPVTWLGDSYRPVYLVSKDDNSVGETLSGSSGTPGTAYYAANALYFNAATANTNLVLQDVRVANATRAISINTKSGHVLKNVQLLNCANGLSLTNAEIKLRNALFYRVMTNFTGSTSTGRVEHLTSDIADRMNQTIGSNLFVTNSVLIAVTNKGTFTSYKNYTNTVATGVLQTVHGGSHYLVNGSTNRGVGTASIDATLFAELKRKTTYPPLVYTNVWLTNSGTLLPRPIRDNTNSVPDLGYHYDALDYVFGGCHVTNDLTFAAGTAIGWFRTSEGWGQLGHAIHIGDYKTLNFSGLVTSNCYFAHQITVQEGLVGNIPAAPCPGAIAGWASDTNSRPNLNLQFVKFSLPATANHIRDAYGTIKVAGNHCEFYSGGIGGYVSTVGLTNSLLHRCNMALEGGVADYFTLQSCTALGAAINIHRWPESWGGPGTGKVPVTIVGCAFENTSFLGIDEHGGDIDWTTYGYNAYISGAARTPWGSNDVTVTSFNWRSNWLGRFYLPTNSTLINVGNAASAGTVGLYHFTTQTNQVKETNSVVDIGYHYVALNASGQPFDFDGDGTPDYLEDKNGNGILDAGETEWRVVITNQPQSQTVSPGGSVTFTVGATGTPLYYRWLFNGTNAIANATNGSLTLNPVSASNAGIYSVIVSNANGQVISSNATLTVTCQSQPSGMVAWWQGEGNPGDSIGSNHGTELGGVGYTNGQVGMTFKFNGTDGRIDIPDTSALRPTNFTIEAWVYPLSLNSGWRTIYIKRQGENLHSIALYAQGGDSRPTLEINTGAEVAYGISGLATNQWSHLVGTYNGTNLILYVNGVAQNEPATVAVTYTAEPAFIGGNNIFSGGEYFDGRIDEITLYNRALSATEVTNLYLAGSIGKCPVAPTIVTQPTSRLALADDPASLTVIATGSPWLTYQWYRNGTNAIAGATNASLVFSSVQTSDSGNYSVIVSNQVGTVTSATATLTVKACFEAIDVALVIDRSSSMNSSSGFGGSGTKFDAARLACSNFVANLIFPSDQAALISFAATTTTNQLLTNSAAPLLQSLSAITIGSGTVMSNALLAAKGELTSSRHNSNALPVLVFLTDGAPDDGTNSILAYATQIKNNGTRLITVGVGTDLQPNHLALLQAMATSTNTFFHATNTAQLTNIYNFIAEDICRGDDPTNQPPIISWVTPVSGQLFVISPTNILLQATNTGGPITAMVYYYGNTLIGSNTVPPYQVLWTDVPNGTYTLKAVGVNSTNGASVPAYITNIVNAMPAVTITSPTNLQKFLEVTNVTITADATDSDGTITNVAFYSGTNFLGNDTAAPYSIVWSNLTDNFYAVAAIATDNRGASRTSPLKVFEVVSVTTAPAVWITYPTNNEVFRAGAEITITANVVSGSGTVTNVEFFVNSRFLGSDSSSPYSITECCWKSGTYELIAKATDSLGAWSISTQVNMTVLAEPLTAQGYWDPRFAKMQATNDYSGAAYGFRGNGVAVGSDGTLLCMASAFSWIYSWNAWLLKSYPLAAVSYDGTNGTMSVMQSIDTSQYEDAVSLGEWNAVKVDGTNIYVGGQNYKSVESDEGYPILDVLKWNGSAWSAVCTNNSFSQITTNNALKLPAVTAIEVLGSDLYVAGTFVSITNTSGIEDTNVQYVARFDSVNSRWVSVATNHLNGPVLTLSVMNGQLYAGGVFSTAGDNTNASCIARLDGNRWVNLESGVGGPEGSVPFVTCLSACGSDLYVGGRFSTVSGDTNVLGIVVWNGTSWKTLGGGPSPYGHILWRYGNETHVDADDWLDPWQGLLDTNAFPVVYAIKARGHEVYVGGRFSSIIQKDKQIPAFNIARAIWSEDTQSWTWSDLDRGTMAFCGGSDAAVRALAIREGPSLGTYDLLVGGLFRWVGHTYLLNPSFALWRVGPLPPGPPTVVVTNPPSGTIFTNPETIQITARITSNYTNIIADSIQFWDNGNLIVQEGRSPYEYPAGSGTYHLMWDEPECGFHTLTASAMDEAGLQGQSEPVFIYVNGSNCVNSVTPGNDLFIVLENELSTLEVLTNDFTSTGNPLQIVEAYQVGDVHGTVEVNWDRKSIRYRSNKNTYGDDNLMYTVTDGVNTNIASVTAKIRVRPDIFIQTPFESDKFGMASNIVIHGTALDYDSTITNIAVFVNGGLIGQVVSPPNSNYVANPTNFFFEWNPGGVSPKTSYAFFTFNWSTNVAGFYTFAARAMDSHGHTNYYTLSSYPILNNYTPPVTVAVTNTSAGPNSPVAAITSYGDSVLGRLLITNSIIVRDGQITNLVGDAYDLDAGDAVMYQLLLQDPKDPDGAPLFNVTPVPWNFQGFHDGGVINGLLGTVDLTTVENGSYILKLLVRSGGEEASDTVPIILDSNLKIGQFSFSEHDLTIPVSGIPLTVVRTYNSMNPRSSDFGYSWTYAINSMDIQLDETRENFVVGGNDWRTLAADEEEDEKTGLPLNVSIRTGGNYGVTLTLPDGRRTTFAFKPYLGAFSGDAEWEAPPGVTATLKAYPPIETDIRYFPYLYWATDDSTYGDPYFDAHDVRGWVLETQDGTKYYITRGKANNVVWDTSGEGNWVNVRAFDPQPKLTRIEQRSGDVITISETEVNHYANSTNLTRSIFMERDEKGRIVAVRDPIGGTNGLPVMKYIYNQDTGNLIQVHRLKDRTNGNYLVTKYYYDHSQFPHFITAIEDSRGIPVARNLYDELGRLIGIIDSAGRTNRFEHDTADKREVHYDRSGNPTVFGYDVRGNVTHTIDALGHTNQFLYDGNGYLTNGADALGNITSFVNDDNGKPLSVTLPYPSGADPANYTTHYTYNEYGEQTSVRLPTGGVITNEFDPVTGMLLAVKDGAGNLISATAYNEQNLPKTETDIFGSLHYTYDAKGNLTHMTNGLNQVTVSGYDANGNLTSLNDGGVPSTIVYDAMNREAAADYGNGITVNYGHDGEGDWSSVDGPTLGHMERKMDTQGRLAGWETANGSTPGYAYDVNGRFEYETNSVGVVTRTVYNAVGWVTATTNLVTGAWAAFDYDAVGRRTVMTNALGFTTRFDYYPSGSLKAMTNAFGTNYWLYTDAAGACSSCGSAGTVTDPLNRTVESIQTHFGLPVSTVWRSGNLVNSNYIEYMTGMVSEQQEAEEYPIAITDEGNRTRRFDYDDFGRLYRATDLSGATWWTNQFDVESGALTNVLSPTGETLSYTYDDLDNVKSIRFGDGNSLTNFYNAENRLNGVRLPSGVLLTNFYDFAGRLTNRSSTIGETNTFEYNGNDAVTIMTDTTGGTTNLHDAAGRLWGIDYPSGVSVRYQLDMLDRIVGITNKASASGTAYVTRYEYDPIGNITNVIDPFNGSTKLEYDRVGRRSKRTLPNNIVTEWQYDWRDRVTNITHKIGGTTLASVLYERLPGGEPSKITREDGTFVELKYDAALRLTNEVYYNASSVAQATNSYGYDASGNRIRFAQPGLMLTNSVSDGYRITAVNNATNGSTAQSYGYDNGGRVTTITRDSATLNLGYNSVDQVTAVTNGANWVTYAHDAAGRRTVSTNNSTVRKFLVAATPGTDLESPQLIANASGTVQQGYVYLGDDPILRFSTSGTAAYYLEDGMGSVIGLAPASSPGTGNTTRIFYDGFGNTRSTAGPAPTIPTGTGGDFRFHGAWLEEQSGLYNMRAREYDSQAGRFTSRDPLEGAMKEPETIHPYVFANSNPFVFADPRGTFNVLEVNFSANESSAMSGFNMAVVQKMRQFFVKRLTRAVRDTFVNHLKSLLPLEGEFDKLKNFDPRKAGEIFQQELERLLCAHLMPLAKYFWFEPRVRRSGDVYSDGISCGKGDKRPGGSIPRPDLIVSLSPPTQYTQHKGILIGEIKYSGNAYEKAYVSPGRQAGQWEAIKNYAANHTYTKTSVLFSFRGFEKTTKTKLEGQALKSGSVVFFISVLDNP